MPDARDVAAFLRAQAGVRPTRLDFGDVAAAARVVRQLDRPPGLRRAQERPLPMRRLVGHGVARCRLH